MSVEASCHCGAVKLKLAAAPTKVTECNCSLCRRYGVLWIYYDKSEVTFEPEAPATDTYLWNGRHVAFHRCAQCGCVTHWAPVSAKRQQLGINARLLHPDLLVGTERIYLDKRDD